jgi:predicted ATPase
LANAYGQAAAYNLVTGNGAAAQRQNEESLAQAQEMGIVSFLALGTVRRGACLIAQERFEEGIAGMRDGISAILATGGTLPALFWCFLASGLGRIGRSQEGLEVAEEGFASVAKTGEQATSPSLHHVKGELLLAQNPSDIANAEQCFRTAIKIARGQSARSEELRATTSVARVLAKQGKRDEARAMLAEIYSWFTEGFDTADLKDAKALLDELSS